jgi:hypothetical protein
MGRPPIGKIAMTGAERLRKFRDKQRAQRPVTKRNPADIAHIRQLEAENARLRAELTQAQANRFTPPETEPGAQAKPPATPTNSAASGKLIRMLGSSNDGEALNAARMLAKSADLHTLAEIWEKHLAQQPKPKGKPKPVDWPALEEAILAYAKGRTNLTMNNVMKAAYAAVPAAKDIGDGGRAVAICIKHRLVNLGFILSKSGMSYTRPQANQ